MKKGFVQSDFETLKTATKMFVYECKNAYVYTAIIILSAIGSGGFNWLSLKTYLQLTTKEESPKLSFWILYILCEILKKFFTSVHQFYCILVIEMQISTVSLKIYKNIFVQNHEVDLTNGKVQYCIHEGADGLSKVVKHMFFTTTMQFIEIMANFAFIKEIIEGNTPFLLFFVFFLVICIHVYATNLKVDCKRRVNMSSIESDKIIYESIVNMDTIKTSNMIDKEKMRYKKSLKANEKAYIKYGFIEDPLDFFETFIFSITVYGLGTYEMYKKENNSVTIVLPKIQALMKVGTNWSKCCFVISGIYRKMKETIYSSQLALEYLRVEKIKRTVKLNNFEKSLQFLNVDIFAGSHKILTNLNFEIKKGEKVALVGKNGIGKTTIFRTILRLQKHEGDVLIDGQKIGDVKNEDYFKLFAYLPQNSILFDETVFYNISYGMDGLEMEKVEETAKKLNLHEAICKMKNKYGTVVGEMGCKISGGLRQKILIARALLRNSQILLFDEPFNNLDVNSKREFIEMIFSDLFKDKTVIVIIHGNKNIELFDKVVSIGEHSAIKSQN